MLIEYKWNRQVFRIRDDKKSAQVSSKNDVNSSGWSGGGQIFCDYSTKKLYDEGGGRGSIIVQNCVTLFSEVPSFV